MNRTLTLLVLAMAALGSAQDKPKIETQLDLTLANKYVWRGVNYVNDWVIQPNLAFSSHGISLSFWGNFELTNWNAPNYTRSPKGRLTELDTEIGYGQPFSEGSWYLGYIDYQYPGTGFQRYGEWKASLNFENTRFSPYVNIFKGDRAAMGANIELGASTDFDAAGHKLNLAGEIGYGDKKSNEFFYGNSKGAFTHVQLDLSTELAAFKGWNFKPSISYATLLDKGHLAGQPRRSNVWLGFTFSRAF